MPISAYLKAGLFVVAAATALFAAAGTVAIPGFWVYLAIFALVMIVSFATLDPDLLLERMRPGGKRPPVSLRIFSLVLFVHWIVAGLDRGRFHWSDDVPGWLQGVCLFTVAAGYALALWAMRVNRFFSSVIRIQTDRGQHVVTTGPYAFVRHPGYTAGILIIAASGLALGSWLAAALVVLFSLPFLLHRRHHGGPNSSSRACRLFGLRRAGPMAASPGHLVRAKLRLGSLDVALRDHACGEPYMEIAGHGEPTYFLFTEMQIWAKLRTELSEGVPKSPTLDRGSANAVDRHFT